MKILTGLKIAVGIGAFLGTLLGSLIFVTLTAIL